MKIYKTGTKIYIDGIPARIAQISIKDKYVSYECAWWSGDTRLSAWLSDKEFTTKSKKKHIGFIK